MEMVKRISVLAAVACCAWAQLPAPGTPARARAAALPLSGSISVGSASAQQSASPASGVATVTSTTQIGGDYQGSVPATQIPSTGPITLSLAGAVQLGLRTNLGALSAANTDQAMRAQRLQALSALLPHLSASAGDTVQQVNLAAYGFQFHAPPGLGFSIPSVVGPFNVTQAQATLSQSIWDPVARRNWKATQATERAASFSAMDARQLVVLAVGGMYMQTVAERERVASQQAQVANAQAVYNQAVVRKQAGMNARIDVMRSLVELDTQKQRLSSLQSQLQKQKIAFARLVGVPLDRKLILSDSLSFNKTAVPSASDAVQQAFRRRPDLKAAEEQVRAAKRALSAAHAERLPSVSLSGDYGVIGPNPTEMHGVFTVAGSVNVPIWEGRRIKGDIQQAEATLRQRQAELANERGAIEQDVRTALVDLRTAAGQVELARSNRNYAHETLTEAQDRFNAGVASTVEVVQAQEQVASAESDYISSLYSFNLAKLALAKATGDAQAGLPHSPKGRQP